MGPTQGSFGAAFSRARGSTPKTELSEKSGISRRSLTRWETEGAEPSLEQLRSLIEALPEGAEDMLRSLGLLPPVAEPQDGLDDDEQSIWELGERRAWSEEARMRLIYSWRAWVQEVDNRDPAVAEYLALYEREHAKVRDIAQRMSS